ncbi:hypothetical protein [Acrocarpospora catenulata]|uniref:hypothetical protein n=1 Tax=Acrocarpospora catenulata TaxID=2836182 RepID=UPI001BDA2BBF|nr:hypothetical protein [Acrocarpospora catenulata]
MLTLTLHPLGAAAETLTARAESSPLLLIVVVFLLFAALGRARQALEILRPLWNALVALVMFFGAIALTVAVLFMSLTTG